MLMDKQHRRIVRLTSNLALLPVQFVPEAWLFILNTILDDAETEKFVLYFEKQ